MPLPKPPRHTPPAEIKKKVIAFYEGSPSSSARCVITEDTKGVQFHHLDENPSRSDVESNFVPLARRLNASIEQRTKRLLPPELHHDSLSERSGRHYAHGRYAYAYGCSILGFTLAWNTPAAAEHAGPYYVSSDTAAFFCANALVSLRPLNRLDYASKLLSLYVAPLVSKNGLMIERPTCARLAMEIGSYFRDAGDFREARRFIRIARWSLRYERKSNRIKTLLARLWQHEGITAITEGNLIRSGDCFKRARDEITVDYSVGLANDKLYEMHALLRADSPQIERALHIAAEYHPGTSPLFVTKWTEIELSLLQAQAHYQKGDAKGRQKGFDGVRDVLKRLTTERVVPTRATFPSVLRAFADEYPSHSIEVDNFERRLSQEFISAAKNVYRALLELSAQ